ncbi:recombinase [Elizabethkingia anophelis]|uniref:site-specific integrase n=1 Tax=Elizabethkingia anophelis TaxID=1117645 RepID=UPI00099A455D|nr:site-specific integrase [Elizabethkingia anophelis]MCT3755600.1 site-specific integrase [Elizabethkingia anophelis]MCT4265931.1 site-specific integrase [Elizabethkingia anophelis]MCT4269803.1 site-specific integrase [Elizabethkingia anophelis]MCT4313580.1 site-specific integrase [Elizabethkingia anophelis]MDV3954937.1 recombinase [Elizabethkingia anophelis]
MKITLKRKNLKDGQISLYIEYYKGSTIDLNGKRIHLREFEYLKLYLNAEPKNAKEKKDNKETLELAENILAIRKTNYIQGKFDIKSTTKSKRTFLNYFAEIMEEKQKQDSSNNYGNWFSTFQHLKKIISPNMTFEEVDETFIKKVRNYIDYDARSKSDLPLSQNSKYSYFNKFKAALRSAFDDGYLSINYATKLKSFDQAESQREYLTFEELQSLSKSPCKYEILKRAFIFSCLTGIRWSDINAMTWSEVRDEGENSRINFRQEKTDGVEYLYISKQARDLLSERQSPEERVFKGLKYSMTYNTEIVRWCNRAGIFKHITFHSARHTNAVLLLEGGADIYTVSKRLGHREIRTTAIYAKIVDKKMKEAAEMIPELNIEL